MKKIGALALGALCALLLAVAALAEETPLAQALTGSEWSAYAPVLEETEGALCAGVARNAEGRLIFAIAEKGEDGAFSLAACYERLISENADLEKLSVTPRPEGGNNKCATVRLSLKKDERGHDDDAVEFIRGETGWSVSWMNATDSEMEADLRLTWWEDGRLTLYAVWKGKEWSFSVPPDAVDLSPEGYSFEGAVREAKRLLEEDKRSRFELARETLQAAFPYDELIAQGEIVEADLRLGEGGETVIAAAAVIDGGNTRVTYFADLYGDAPVHTVCHNLVPSWAEKVVIETPCRVDREDEYGTWNYARFEAGSIRYTVELTYDRDDRLYAYRMDLVTAAKRNADDETEYQSISFSENWMELERALPYGSLCFEIPEICRSMRTFDPTVARSAAENAVIRHEAGEAPFIPVEEGEYVIPSPCGAKLRAGTWDVYSGPGEEYFREANGRAAVSANDWAQVFGREGEWALIQYRVRGAKLRFGYVNKKAIEDFDALPELHFEAVSFSGENDFVTSDPLGECDGIELPGETWEMTRLATLGDVWFYVELTLPTGETARMFAEKEASHG